MNLNNIYINAESERLKFKQKFLLRKSFVKQQTIHRNRESIKYIQDCLDFNLVPTFVKISDKNQTQLELSRGEVFRLQKKNSKKN